MDSQRWLVLILLGTSLGGVIAYLVVLGRRLKRLKQILAQSPREPIAPVLSTQAGKKGPSSARRGGAPAGLALAQEAEWAEETIATQRPVSSMSAPVPLETGASLVERAGSSSASPVAQATAAGSADGDLLKKLLTFDSGRAGAGESSGPSAVAPSVEAARPPGGRASELLGLLAPKQVPTAQASGQSASPATMGRLGAFMAQDVGAPESAKVKPMPVVSAPSFSLGGPAPAASGGDAPARRSPLDLMKGGGASPSSRDRGVPVAQVLGDAGTSQSSPGGLGRAEEAVPPAPAPPGSPARDASIMSRLGGLSGGGLAGALESGPLAATASALRLTRPAGEAGAGQASPLSSLMGRLGGASGESSSTPFSLDSLKSAGAERPPVPAASPVSPALRFGLERPNERPPAAGGAAGGALQRLSQLSRTAPAEPAAPAVQQAPVAAPPAASGGVAGSLAALSRLSLKPAPSASPGPAGVPRTGGLQIDRLKALSSAARPAERPPQPAAVAPERAAVPSDATGPAKKKLVLNFKTLGSAR